MPETERTCPKCGSLKVLPIVYGLLPYGAEPPGETYVTGGCLVDARSPEWACTSCHARWSEDHDRASPKQIS
jgi:hypothetical protein